MEERIYSRHTFILPFTINESGLAHYTKEFSGAVNVKKEWKAVRDRVKLDYLKSIPEQYDFNRLFNDEFLRLRENYLDYIYQFEHEPTYYEILIDKGKEGVKVYDLEMDYVMIRFLDGGCRLGFLVISCINRRYKTLKEYAEINHYGRYVYDPIAMEDSSKGIAALEILKTSCPGEGRSRCHDYRVEHKKRFKFGQRRIRRLILDFLCSFFGETELDFFDDGQLKQDWLTSVLDDRMLVQASYGLEAADYKNLADVIRNLNRGIEERTTYAKQKQLTAYLNVIREDLSCQSQRYLKQGLDKAIHDWHLDYGTFYGLTTNAMILFYKHGIRYQEEVLRRFYSSYLELFLFVLAQRMKLLYFAFRAAELSDETSLEDRLHLLQDYIRFKSCYLSPEICPHEETIVIYEKLQEAFYVEDYKKDLDDHIKSLYEIGMLDESLKDSEQTKALNRETALLNRSAFALGVLTIMTSLVDFYSSVVLLVSKEIHEEVVSSVHDSIIIVYCLLIIGIVCFTYIGKLKTKQN